MARYVDPHVERPGDRARARHRPVTEALVAARRRSGAAGAGRIQSRLLPAAAHALSGGDRGAGRRLSAAPAAGDLRARAGGRGGLRPAAGHQAAAHAAAADRRRDGAVGARRALRAVHLRHGAADPEGAGRHQGRSLRADLDEPAAGARLGLSRAAERCRSLLLVRRRSTAEPPMANPKILVFPGSIRTGSHNVAAGGAGGQGADADRRRRHAHLARRLSAADLRRRSRRPKPARRPTRSSSSR